MAVQAVNSPARAAPLLLALLLSSLSGAASTQDQQPSTFGPVIGSALLCRDQLDNKYFYSWLSSHFGAPYKHEGGAFWFRTGEATLWGAPVTEVMVSDDTSELVFLAAVAEVPPDQLEQSIRSVAGVKHVAADSSQYPLRVSAPGSTIAYYNSKSKIYCAKFKPLPPGR
ncbi:hypothetical protein ACFQ09_24190 [Massilia norwichensis]|uniref:Uncharacterized protein n=1 Tax=Massilia norwichensis TaxID=1442366 RepID=A0ABT2A3T6_9BURK|nr:hypothetical protein [Massilia norwichensis]MCS0588745.1 hypothetical protein [Massilia norwichensis]